MSRTKKISRWVNVYGEPINGLSSVYLSRGEALEGTKRNSFKLLATIELIGAYTLKDRERLITESEVREAIDEAVRETSWGSDISKYATDELFGEDES